MFVAVGDREPVIRHWHIRLEKSISTIWIDLDNSPHVPLFVPIIRHYRDKGVEVIVTARDHSQTIELLNLAGLKGTYFIIGRHYGKNKLKKIWGLLSRTLDLAFIGRANVAIAISHGSRSMVLAALGLRIPVLTMYDYEYTETRMFNKLSDKVMVPDAIPDEVLDEIGLALSKRVKYSGIKEELYVREFQPTPNFREHFLERYSFNDSDEKILAVLRPPATTANYHSKKSEVLLDDILHFLRGAPDVITVIVPRTKDQGMELERQVFNIPDAKSRCLILDEAVNGLDLANSADLVISGGGTMNREAVLLGVPVYSIFAGKLGSLDAQMENEGLITFIREISDVTKIKLVKRSRDTDSAIILTDRVESAVKEQIDSFLDR